MSCARDRDNGTLITGIILIAVGAIFLLQKMGILNAFNVLRLWPLFFFACGIKALFQSEKGSNLIGAVLMFLIGGMFLAINFGYATWGTIWPFTLIGVGAMLLAQSFTRKREVDAPIGPLRPNVVFGSLQRRIEEVNFTGGKVSSVFGSAELDFSRAVMQGDSAVLQVEAVFGNIEMRVPDTWTVVLETAPVFGNCENQTRPPLPSSTPKTLFVRGDVVFGNVEVRN